MCVCVCVCVCACVCVWFLVPFAFVVLKEESGLDRAAVLKQLRELVTTKIAKYAVPEHFLVRPSATLVSMTT